MHHVHQHSTRFEFALKLNWGSSTDVGLGWDIWRVDFACASVNVVALRYQWSYTIEFEAVCIYAGRERTTSTERSFANGRRTGVLVRVTQAIQTTSILAACRTRRMLLFEFRCLPVSNRLSRRASSRVEASRVESSRVESSRVESSRVESSRVESSRV